MSQATAAHRTTLVSAASTLDLDLADAQVDLLLAYMDWLHKWNKVYNLTALRHPDEMLSHHLIDSLTAVGGSRARCRKLARCMCWMWAPAAACPAWCWPSACPMCA